MNRYLMLAAALVACAAATSASAQTASDLAEREAIVRERFVPAFVSGLRPPLGRSWEKFPAADVYPDELAAARAAHVRAVDEMVERVSTRAGAILLDHIPLDQLLTDDNVNTPEWQAALTELRALVADAPRDGVELAAQVIEAGCRVRPVPSATCADRLRTMADYRAGRLTVDDFRSE